jgi:hypothetical protein
MEKDEMMHYHDRAADSSNNRRSWMQTLASKLDRLSLMSKHFADLTAWTPSLRAGVTDVLIKHWDGEAHISEREKLLGLLPEPAPSRSDASSAGLDAMSLSSQRMYSVD